jgi:hypothetical protein
MENYSKIKWTPGWYTPILVFVFLCAIVVEVTETGRLGYTVWAFGAFFIFLGIRDYYQSRLVTNLCIGMLFGTGTWHALLAFNRVRPFTMLTYFLQVIAVAAFFIFSWPVLRRQWLLRRNARRLFSLAADEVHDSADGFTSRPFDAGRFELNNDEILGFVRFLNSELIARAVVRKEAIFLTFSLGISPLANPELPQVSYVSFAQDGHIAVHISAYDYRRYRDQLTFDQLCTSLAGLFKRFLHYYQEGNESRIRAELQD